MDMKAMYHKKTQRLVEICPQCCRGVDRSTARLVSDACGHIKCRVCLLQEINGCLKCAADIKNEVPNQPPRKSVITSLEEQQADTVDGGTCRIIEQTLQKDILFPTEIVKRSSGNFFHLKRIISERFFNETGKVDKNCGTETESKSCKVPNHLIYYCSLHKLPLTSDETYREHSSCSEGLEVSHKCSVCAATFTTKYKLKRHGRSHVLAAKFQCEVCGKRFKDNYAVRTHMRKHTGDKIFGCEVCGASLAQLWSLKRHLAKHRGDRPFTCDLCGHKFLTRPELKRHSVTHTRGKTFVCSTCDARFSFQRSLARHQAVHKNVTSLQCDFCESTFNRKDNLHRHIRNTHSDDV